MNPEERKAHPSCTSEGINYIIECLTCRQNGVRRKYCGESSRSGYQRGAEHQKEIDSGLLSHPLVLRFWEEHGGRKQEVMMRILSTHITPMERQIREAVNIGESSKKGQECLNLKNEWG